MTDLNSDSIFVICDRCGERIYNPTKDNCIEEDGLVYHKECFEEMLSKE